jgi:hypothetical protein
MPFLLLFCLWGPIHSLSAQTYQPRTYGPEASVYAQTAYAQSTEYDDFTYLFVPVGTLCLTCNDCQVATATTAPFPVEWLQVTAERMSADSVRVQWDVWQEHSRGLFVIERRLAHEDSFRAVGQRHEPRDGWLSLDHYDANDYADLSYYRIREYDHEGQNSLSEQRVVRGWQSQNLQLYPNPCRDILHLRLHPGGEASQWQLCLSDSRGRAVWRQRGQGEIPSQLSLADFPPGAYWLSLQVDALRWRELVIRRP